MAAPISSDDQMKMMMDDFNKLQNQLIELRTQNYDIDNKLRRSEAENISIHEKCSQQEKEIQKLNKLMKFPGFQALSKSKTKKDLEELIEENERLNHQMQRHEDDFKLQNQTLLQEVSRLSNENHVLENQLKTLKSAPSSINDEDIQKLSDENLLLKKTNDELKQKSNDNSQNGHNNDDPSNNIYTVIDNLQIKFIAELRVMFNCTELDSNETPTTEEPDGPIKSDISSIELKTMFDTCFTELKNNLSILKSGNSEESIVEESNKLRQKLSTVRESSKKEIQELRDEVSKWTEKAKKKQESFVKLQEEKEKMYEDHKVELDVMKNESALSKQHSNRTEELNQQLHLLSKEKETLQGELSNFQEKQNAFDMAKFAEFESRVNNLEAEKESFVHQIGKLTKIIEGYEKNNQSLHKSFENAKTEVEKISELAERRKCLLDTNALERQQDIENHQNKLEEVKDRHNKEMEEIVEQKSNEINDLKNQISTLKKVKKELDENNKKYKKEVEDNNALIINLNEKLQSIEKKSGWLERTLSEEQDNCKLLKEQHEQQLNEMTNTFLKEKDEQQKIYQSELFELEKSLRNAKVNQQEHDSLVEKLKQSAKDHEIELAIGKKKNDQLIKDLKRQLTAERKKADQLSQKLENFIQEVKVKQTYDEIFNPESLQMKLASSHRRQDSGSHISNVSSVNENEDSRSMKTSSPVDSANNLSVTSNLNISGMSTGMPGLSDETMDLISRYADLQQEKWKLEERVRHLEETGAAMADDVMQKSLIIQHYVMEKKGDTPPVGRKVLTLKEKMFDKLKQIGTEELNREMSNKMQRILEETLATNVQLQKDLDLVTGEIQQLKSSTNTS